MTQQPPLLLWAQRPCPRRKSWAGRGHLGWEGALTSCGLPWAAGVCGLMHAFIHPKHLLCVLGPGLGEEQDTWALEQVASSQHVEDTDMKMDPHDLGR